jgi:hypothetical protein
MVGDAHISESPAIDALAPAGVTHGDLRQRLKSAAPAAGAIGIISAIVVGALVATSPPGGEAPPAGEPPPSAANATPPISPGNASVQFDQPPPGAGPQRVVELVVKFKDDAKIKPILDSFWTDPATAKTRFEAWKANRPEFARLKLDRVTYSNELVLVLDGGVPAAERVAAIRDIVKALGAASDISYAEQQATMAQPGGQ